MLKFIRHKLLNKKWLNLCLLVGVSLLAAVFSCHAMFKNGSLNKLLQKSFTDYAEENGEYPAVISRSGSCATASCKDVASVYKKLEAYESKWTEYIDTGVVNTEQLIRISGSSSSTSLGGKNKYFDIGMVRDMDEHITIVKGESLAEGSTGEGVYPCIVSERVMDTYSLVTGEVITMDYCLDSDGNPAKFKIVGIFSEKDTGDNFWFAKTGDKIFFTDEDSINDFVSRYQAENILYDEYMLLDYTQINCSNAKDYKYYIEQFENADDRLVCNFTELLCQYVSDEKTVNMILWVLELPVCVLLLAFIYMVSSQILELEEPEIAMLKSRGVSSGQIVGLYALQSVIISLLGSVTGIILGYGLCRFAASTDSFLVFAKKDVSGYVFTYMELVYALIACAVAVLFMTLPVFKLSGTTIIQLKDKRLEEGKKPFWEKYFLEIILLVISVYLLYNYYRQSDSIALNALSGGRLDPVIFLDSSLFILAAGLFVLRLVKYLVRFVYFLGRKRWKPAMYASFLQIMRNRRKQGFISVFLVMTIAMGVFDANLAGTINKSNRERIEYNEGCDVRIQEKWSLKAYVLGAGNTVQLYTEPDYERYRGLTDENICDSMTRVLIDENADVSMLNKTVSGCLLMGINTKEFGETAVLKTGLNEEHWYNALNSLAACANGVIISRNLADKLEADVGTTITYSRYNSIFDDEDGKKTASGQTVCAIVDAWPGYDRYSYTENEDGTFSEDENYLIVANYATVVSKFGQTPYSIWMKLSDSADANAEAVEKYTSDNDIRLQSISSISGDMDEMQDSALIQITNGMFTISFLISIILCLVGFLIYWILSVKSRQLSFGIYRAMGMSRQEVGQMFVNEQIFTSVPACAAGIGTGFITTKLFTGLIALVYLPEKHNIAVEIFISLPDMVKVAAVVLVMVLICIVIMRKIVGRMKITQALKMGED